MNDEELNEMPEKYLEFQKKMRTLIGEILETNYKWAHPLVAELFFELAAMHGYEEKDLIQKCYMSFALAQKWVKELKKHERK